MCVDQCHRGKQAAGLGAVPNNIGAGVYRQSLDRWVRLAACDTCPQACVAGVFGSAGTDEFVGSRMFGRCGCTCLAGVLLSLVGDIIINVGMNSMKYAHNINEDPATGKPIKHFTRIPWWWFGILGESGGVPGCAPRPFCIIPRADFRPCKIMNRHHWRGGGQPDCLWLRSCLNCDSHWLDWSLSPSPLPPSPFLKSASALAFARPPTRAH